MEKFRYPSLNGLRAISIILVIIHHLSTYYHIFDKLVHIDLIAPFLFFLEDGNLGVNVFFVISGFLITSLLLQEEANTGTISLKKFYIRRTLRIFPAYYFVLLVYFILQLFQLIHISTSSWITSITYTKYFNFQEDRVTAHFWSLSLEEFFYVFWPLIFLRAIKLRKSIVIALICLVPLLRIYLYTISPDTPDALVVFTRIDAIAIGCLFAINKNYIVNKISSHWNIVLYGSLLCLFFLRYLQFPITQLHLTFILIPLGETHGTIANFLIAVIMICSVFGPQGIWFKLLNLKVMNYIGILSYSLYLWQQIFLSGTNQWAMQLPQNILMIFMMALFSYYIIEKPFLKLKSRFQFPKSEIEIPENAKTTGHN